MSSKNKQSKEDGGRVIKRHPLKVKSANVEKTNLFGDNFLKRHFWSIIILALVSLIIYWPTLGYEYVLDDKIVLSENNYVKKGLSGIWEILSTESFQGYFGEQKDLLVGARYRPLSIVTFAIEYHFFGLNPKVSHLGNIILYIITLVVLLRLGSVLFQEHSKWLGTIAFWGSALFMLHPVHVEVVANIKGRDEIMTLLGSLLALYFYLKYLNSGRSFNLLWMALAYFGGLLSKENALTFLAIIPATGYFFTKAPQKQQIKAGLVLFIVSIVYLIIRSKVIGYFLDGGTEVKALMNNPFLEMNNAEKYATILYTLGLYLKLLIFPHPLTHDYYPYHIPIMKWLNWQVLISLTVYVFLIWKMFRGISTKNLNSYAIIFYLASLSIVSNLVFPVGTFMNERFIYIPSVAFCFWLAFVLIDYLPKQNWALVKSKPLYTYVLLGLLVIGYTWKTVTRIPAWKNGFELNKAAIEVSKNSARANMFMGTAYFNLYEQQEDTEEKLKYLDLAEPYIDKSLEIHPNYGDGLTMKAGVAAERFKIDKDLDKLLETFYLVLTRRPSHQYTNQYLDYMIRVKLDPVKQEEFYYKLAYEFFYKQQNRADLAINFLQKGLQISPNSARLNKAMALAYEKSGNSLEARNYHNRANSILPGIEL